MLDALADQLPAQARWTRPQGGLFIWVTLPDYIDTTNLLARALAANVAFVPGQAAFTDGRGANSMRAELLELERRGPARGRPADRRDRR